MGDKDIYRAEKAMFGKWGHFSNFKQWLNDFLTRHGCKPRDLYVYTMEDGERVVIECMNIIEVLMSTSEQMHPQIKIQCEMKEKAGVNIRDWIGRMGANFYNDGYFDRDPRFKKAKIRLS